MRHRVRLGPAGASLPLLGGRPWETTGAAFQTSYANQAPDENHLALCHVSQRPAETAGSAALELSSRTSAMYEDPKEQFFLSSRCNLLLFLSICFKRC